MWARDWLLVMSLKRIGGQFLSGCPSPDHLAVVSQPLLVIVTPRWSYKQETPEAHCWVLSLLSSSSTFSIVRTWAWWDYAHPPLHSQYVPTLCLEKEEAAPLDSSFARDLPAYPLGFRMDRRQLVCTFLPEGIFVKINCSQRKGAALALSLKWEKLIFHLTNILIPD